MLEVYRNNQNNSIVLQVKAQLSFTLEPYYHANFKLTHLHFLNRIFMCVTYDNGSQVIYSEVK